MSHLLTQCDPDTNGGRWPSTAPCGLHGACLLNPIFANLTQATLTVQGQLENDAPSIDPIYVCACDEGWSSAGDFITAPHQYCHINQQILLGMWISSFCFIIFVFIAWIRVVKAYLKLMNDRQQLGQQNPKSNNDPQMTALNLSRASQTSDTRASGQIAFMRCSKYFDFREMGAKIVWLLENPTRRVLTTILFVMIFFGVTTLMKIIAIAINLNDGAHHTPSTSTYNIGYAAAPTFFYCLASILFPLFGKLSSLIWASSAQSFYPRSEGQHLMKSTVKEICWGMSVDWASYLLAAVATIMANSEHFSMPPSQHDSYEMVVALHFQLKGLIPIVLVIIDFRIAQKFLAHLKKHSLIQDQLQAATKVAKQQQLPQTDTLDQESELESGFKVKRLTVVDEAPEVAQVVIISPSNKYLVATTQPEAAHSRSNSAKPENLPRVSSIEEQQQHSADTLALTTAPCTTDNSVQDVSLPFTPNHSNMTIQSPSLPLSISDNLQQIPTMRPLPITSAGISNPLQPLAEQDPTTIPGTITSSAPSSPVRASDDTALLQFRPLPSSVTDELTLKNLRRHTMATMNGDSTTAHEIELTQTTNSITTKPSPIIRGMSRSIKANPRRATGGPLFGQTIVRPIFTQNSRRVTVGEIQLAQPTSIAPTKPSISSSPSNQPPPIHASIRNQAAIQADHRSQLHLFTFRLKKHLRVSLILATSWLLISTVFAWVPLLRSFVPYVLPLQIFASLGAVRTFMFTLQTKEKEKEKDAPKTSQPKSKETGVGKVEKAPTPQHADSSLRDPPLNTPHSRGARSFWQDESLVDSPVAAAANGVIGGVGGRTALNVDPHTQTVGTHELGTRIQPGSSFSFGPAASTDSESIISPQLQLNPRRSALTVRAPLLANPAPTSDMIVTDITPTDVTPKAPTTQIEVVP